MQHPESPSWLNRGTQKEHYSIDANVGYEANPQSVERGPLSGMSNYLLGEVTKRFDKYSENDRQHILVAINAVSKNTPTEVIDESGNLIVTVDKPKAFVCIKNPAEDTVQVFVADPGQSKDPALYLLDLESSLRSSASNASQDVTLSGYGATLLFPDGFNVPVALVLDDRDETTEEKRQIMNTKLEIMNTLLRHEVIPLIDNALPVTLEEITPRVYPEEGI